MPKAQRPSSRAMPAASEIITTLPPRAMTSSMFDRVFSNSPSGDADLGAGEGRQDHIGLARDRAFRLVDDGDDLLSGLAAIAQRRERVEGLAGLRNDDRGAVARHRRRAVAEFRGDIGLDRDAGE